jgi:hypothetical protein
MTTPLYLWDTTTNAIGSFLDFGPTENAPSSPFLGVEAVTTTTASGTNIQWTRTAGGAVLEWITGRSPIGGWTLAGAIAMDMSFSESAMATNAGPRARFYKRTAAGSESEIGTASPADQGAEFLNGSFGAHTWSSVAPTSTAFAEDDRFILRMFVTNAGGTMAAGTASLRYNGTFNTFSSDAFINLTETVTFKAEEVVVASLVYDHQTLFRNVQLVR